MISGVFVTGTDTGVGKTLVSQGGMKALQSLGYRVAGMKPVASGCEQTADGLINDDASRLKGQSSVPLTYEQVNPYAFEAPIAPHLAAAASGRIISLDVIETAYRNLAEKVDTVVVEGVGGWLVPLGSGKTMADLVVRLNLPAIMVVAVRLGCLNHALLTAASIKSMGVPLLGWVANRVDPECIKQDENVEALRQQLDSTFLADLPYRKDGLSPVMVAEHITGAFARVLGDD